MVLENKVNAFKNFDRLIEINLIQNLHNGNVEPYLTRWIKEDPLKFQWRKDSSYFIDFINPTIEGLSSIILKKEPSLEYANDDIDEVTEEFFNNIDMANTSLKSFMFKIVNSSIRDGLCVVTTETNRINKKDITSMGDEQGANVRSYLKLWDYSKIVNWRYNDDLQLTQITLLENFEKDVGDFGCENWERYLVYKIGGGDIYECVEGGEPNFIGSWKNSLKEIPISIFYGTNNYDKLDARSILGSLAKLNKHHYNLKSELRNIVHLASNPIPIIYGTPNNTELTIGVNTPIEFLQKDQMGFEWVEINGQSVNIAEKEIDKVEDYIFKSSFSILSHQATKTATEARLNDARNKSILYSIIDSLESGLNDCFNFASLLSPKLTTPEIILNRDLGDILLTEQRLKTLLEVRKNGDLSLNTLWRELVYNDMLKEFDKDEEEQKLNDELSLDRG